MNPFTVFKEEIKFWSQNRIAILILDSYKELISSVLLLTKNHFDEQDISDFIFATISSVYAAQGNGEAMMVADDLMEPLKPKIKAAWKEFLKYKHTKDVSELGFDAKVDLDKYVTITVTPNQLVKFAEEELPNQLITIGTDWNALLSKYTERLKKIHNKETKKEKSRPVPKQKEEPNNVEEIIAKALPYIEHFKGYWKHRKIMSDSDFERLTEYTRHLIKIENCPTDIKPIPRTPLSNQHILYTYYLIHWERYGNERNRAYYQFLTSAFSQLSNTEIDTIHKKFSTPTSSYNADVKEISSK